MLNQIKSLWIQWLISLVLLLLAACAHAQVTFTEIWHPQDRWTETIVDTAPEECVVNLNTEPNQYLNALSLVILNSPSRDSHIEARGLCSQVTDRVVAIHQSETAGGGLIFQAVPGPGQDENSPVWLDFQLDREVYLRAYNTDGHTELDSKGTGTTYLHIRLMDMAGPTVIFEQRFWDTNAIQDVELDYFPGGPALIDPVPETYHLFTPFTENPRNWRLPMKAGDRFKLFVKEQQQLDTGFLDPLKPGDAARAKTGWSILFSMSPRTE